MAIHTIASGKIAKRLWALDADLQAAFDRLGHDHILASLGTFPARDLVRQWLKAGVFEDGGFAPTREGTPQGGVVSPLLMNVALHGMEEAAGVRYYRNGDAVPGCPVVVRYADDLVALCHSQAAGRAGPGDGSPDGWRPAAWPSTRTRRGSPTLTRGWTSWGSRSAGSTASC